MKTLRPSRSDIANFLSYRIVIDGEGRKAIYYKIPELKTISSEQVVTRTKKTEEMMCTCEFKSLHPDKPELRCKHIDAVNRRIDREGEETW